MNPCNLSQCLLWGAHRRFWLVGASRGALTAASGWLEPAVGRSPPLLAGWSLLWGTHRLEEVSIIVDWVAALR